MTGTEPSTGTSAVLAALFAACAVLAAGAFAWASLGIGLLGAAALVAGLARGSRGTVTAGSAALIGAAILSGARGAPGLAVLVSVAAAVLAWDVGRHGLSLGHQVGRESPTRRVELAHAAASTAVGGSTVLLGFLASRASIAGQTTSALVLLVVAALFLLAVLRSVRSRVEEA